MKTRLLLILILTVTIVAAHTNVVSSQDDEAAAARELAARQAAEARAEQARADALEKSRKDFIDKQNKQTEANLDSLNNSTSNARERANEIRFAQMQTSASLLLSLSQKINGELQAGGAQSVSVFLFKDLDEVEKAARALRKAAK